MNREFHNKHQYSLPFWSFPIVAMLALAACRDPKSDNESSTLIVGGTAVIDQTDPVYGATIALMSYGGSFCTGTLIGPNHVVSAAHCFEDMQAGAIDVGGGAFPSVFSGTKVTGVKIHPRYYGLENDIAVVAFAGSIPPSFKPVPIANLAINQSGQPMIMAGYGMHGENNSGDGGLRKATGNIASFSATSREFEMVPGTGKGTCYGDSGGPVFIQSSNGELSVIGATSRGESCDFTDGVYTDVRYFQGWMKCSFAAMGMPLAALADDGSSSECSGGTFNPGSSTNNSLPPNSNQPPAGQTISPQWQEILNALNELFAN